MRLKILITFFSVFTSFWACGQIMEDSTVQVVAYWDKGEQYTYSISQQIIKLRDADTVSNEMLTYDVNITVLDSTADSYVVEWFYHNYHSDGSTEFQKRLNAIAEDIKVIIETDELGAFKSVKNWKEVRDYMEWAIGKVAEEFKELPNAEKLFTRLARIYSSKEAIESVAIQDIMQFLTFHGGKYLLGEIIEGNLEVPNLYNDDPLDSKIKIHLDEINFEDNNYVIRSEQEVDQEQLTNVVYEYLKTISETVGGKAFSREEIGQVTNVTYVASRIHNTGWPIYSVQTKYIESGNTTRIDNRIIEIQ